VKGNDTKVHVQMDFGANITNIVVNNLTMGRHYLVRVSGLTSKGGGPFSDPVGLTMDLKALGTSRKDGGNKLNGTDSSAQMIKEVWFIILMGTLLFLFLLLLVIILYSRRKSHGKKDHISSKSTVCVTISVFFVCVDSLSL